MANWKRARERVAKLASLDKALQAPGSRAHRYALGEPVSEDVLAAWEAREGIALPADLRAYYAVCGDGGAGPLKGIRPLAEVRVRGARDGLPRLVDAIITGRSVALCLDPEGALIELPEESDPDDDLGAFVSLFDDWLELETRRFEAVSRLYPTARSCAELTAQAEAALGPFPVADYFSSVVGAPRPAGLFGADDEIRNWNRQCHWYEDVFRRYKARHSFLNGPAGTFMSMFPRKRRLAKG